LLKSPICSEVATGFSHATYTIICSNCQRPVAFPTGGRIRLVDGVVCRTRPNFETSLTHSHWGVDCSSYSQGSIDRRSQFAFSTADRTHVKSKDVGHGESAV
jgi:ribosomal protein S27E